MRAFLIWLLVWIAPAAMAQTVSVASGEHDRFSRLVLTFPKAVTWQVFRTETGYSLTVEGQKPRYDLSDVFRLIPRTRLGAIFADPSTGALQLGIACACHIMPFELRPGIVVLDIQEGPAPAGSSFEFAGDGSTLDALAGRARQRPIPRPETRVAAAPLQTLDWRADLVAAARNPALNSPASAFLDPGNPALDEMRSALLWQIGRGAAKGVVEMTAPGKSSADGVRKPALSAQGHLNIGGPRGLDADAGSRLEDHMTEAGVSCIADDALDLSTWAGPESVAAQIGLIRSGLVGEFDRPERDAVAKAVKFYLHSGFGMEARQLLQALETGSPDRAVWESMAYILDEEVPPASAFAAMEVCDTFAALWAVLSNPDLPKNNALRTDAVLRSFSALPLHLRRHLGPGLADRYLKADAAEPARAIRDAILRAPGEQGAGVRLIEAEIALASDPNLDAHAALAPLTAVAGPVGMDATISLITRQAASGAVVDAAQTTAVAAYLHENKGSPKEQALRDVLAIGLATQGLYAPALEMKGLSPAAMAQLWNHLAASGPDSALIDQAVVIRNAPLPDIPASIKNAIAARLVGLGFAEPALIWLQTTPPESAIPEPTVQILLATAHLLRGDARSALAVLAGRHGPEVEALRARALDQLNDPAAITAHGKSGDPGKQEHSARRLQAWDTLASLSSDPVWTRAADLLAAPATTDPALPALIAGPQPAEARQTVSPTPLAASRALLTESAEMRSVLESLLKASALPPLAD